MCFRSVGLPHSLLLLGQVLTAVKELPGGHRGAAGVWERALGVQLQPQACIRRRRALRPEHWVGTGTMAPRVLHPGGAGSAPGRAASGLRSRRSLCWGSEHGGCGRAGGALLRWDPPRWDRGDSLCVSLPAPSPLGNCKFIL